MSAVRQSLSDLSLDERRLVEGWLDEFEAGWHPGRLAEQVTRLPSRGHRMRSLLLAEMVKVDLERQWRAGQRPSLESYLARFPELGTAGTVDDALVQAEFDALLSAGKPVDWAALVRRFPRQAAVLQSASIKVPRATPPRAPAAVPADTHPRAAGTHSQADAAQMAGDLPERFGRYRIIKRLGAGGMGTVYQATDTQLGRQVAIKVPRIAGDDTGEWIARFYREAGTAASFHHSNLCPVYDVGEIEGVHYLTMAYVDGETLAKVIASAKDKPQSGIQIAVLLRTIALALAEAHRGGIIHRDLKPTNIMIDRRGEPIVMDFGLARRASADESRLTATGALLGSPAYMPPEQALNDSDALGPACDIYSLGVILYELLCGRLPFEGPVVAVLGQILTVEPEPPSRRRAGVDPALEAICLKAMEKKAAARYASMDELAAALTQYLRDGASTPRPMPAGICTQISPRVANEQAAPVIAAPPTNRDRGAVGAHLTRLSSLRSGLERARNVWREGASWKRRAVAAGLAAALLLGIVILVRAVTKGKNHPLYMTLPPKTGDPADKSAPKKNAGETLDLAIAPFKAAEAKRYQDRCAAALNAEPLISNSIDMKLALIPPGEFMMGAAKDEEGASDDEKPRHRVRISRGFYLGIHEVTQAEYGKVTGKTPSRAKGDDLPVECVAAVDAEKFCRLLTDREHAAGRLPMEAIYRLPTEAEWEYAARAGTKTKWYSGDNDKQLDGYAWYSQNSSNKTHPVGEKLQNAWGLFDMHGNVWEWCSDWEGLYSDAEVADPTGPKAGKRRVQRGGAFVNLASLVRSANRATNRHNDFSGFRVARTYPTYP